jgi:hypothetical protein
LVGVPVWALLTPEQRPAAAAAIQEKLANPHALAPFTRTFLRTAGSPVELTVHETVIRDADDNVIGLRSVLVPPSA